MSDKLLRPPQLPITERHLKLLTTPREELKKQVDAYSFDYERFLKRVENGERWQVLLQAHLYLDHVITLVLVEALERPDELDVRRMSFSQKLQFISATNLLSRDLLPPVARINDLRNKIAHDLEFEITDKDERDLRNCVPKYLNDFILEGTNRETNGPPQLDEIIQVVLLAIEFARQSNALRRILDLKMAIRVRTTLEHTPGAVYNE